MKIKLKRSYKKASKVPGQPANTVFVYGVSGTEAELEAYKDAQGENLVLDDETDEPLFFTIRCAPDGCDLLITKNGTIVPDMQEFDRAASLAKQYGGNLGEEMARAAATRLMGFGPRVPSSTPTPEPKTEGGDLGGK